MPKEDQTPKFRQAIKDRCGEACYICGKSPVVYQHVIPIWCGGKDEVGNYVALCSAHYEMMRMRNAEMYENRFWVKMEKGWMTPYLDSLPREDGMIHIK